MKIKEPKKYGHVMLDLETMGNKSNSAIVSIGAVEFNIETGETDKEFYEVIDLQSCLDVNLKINASTLYWWFKQSEQAQNEIAKGGKSIKFVLNKFSSWFSCFENEVQIWGNGARFDIGILEDAYVTCGYQQMPWNFRNERDLRTLVSFAPEIKINVFNSLKNDMIEHNPIDDCKIQIAYASKIWNKFLKNGE